MGEMVVQEQIVRVRNELGIHARPAAQIAQVAQKFTSKVQLVLDGREIDAASILDILSLAAPKGKELCLRARGDDACEAVASIAQLFEDRFGEEH